MRQIRAMTRPRGVQPVAEGEAHCRAVLLYDPSVMLCPTLTELGSSVAAVANSSGRPPDAPAAWMLLVASLGAAVAWYLHWRWRRGLYFMSRFTTAEREAAKWAVFGYALLPSAIGCTTLTAMLALWRLCGPPTNPWYGYLFLILGAVFLVAGGWALKEWFLAQQAAHPRVGPQGVLSGSATSPIAQKSDGIGRTLPSAHRQGRAFTVCGRSGNAARQEFHVQIVEPAASRSS